MDKIILPEDKFLLAAQVLEIAVTKLTHEERGRIRRQIADIFEPGNWREERKSNWHNFFCDNAVEYATVYDHESWQWIAGFLRSKAVLFLLDDGSVFEIGDGRYVPDLLGITWWNGHVHPFYVTNQDFEFLIGYSEAYLYAVGTAMPWLEAAQRDALYQLLAAPPEPVSITAVTPGRWGENLTLDCIYARHSQRLPFRLVFRDMTILEWQHHLPDSDEREAGVGLFHRYEAYGRNRVVIRTSHFRLKLAFKEIAVEKTW